MGIIFLTFLIGITLFMLIAHIESECSRGAYLDGEKEKAESKSIKLIALFLILALILMACISRGKINDKNTYNISVTNHNYL